MKRREFIKKGGLYLLLSNLFKSNNLEGKVNDESLYFTLLDEGDFDYYLKSQLRKVYELGGKGINEAYKNIKNELALIPSSTNQILNKNNKKKAEEILIYFYKNVVFQYIGGCALKAYPTVVDGKKIDIKEIEKKGKRIFTVHLIVHKHFYKPKNMHNPYKVTLKDFLENSERWNLGEKSGADIVISALDKLGIVYVIGEFGYKIN